ncbi:MAG TPA: methyltransferase [Gammaproteobacteria bacterium]
MHGTTKIAPATASMLLATAALLSAPPSAAQTTETDAARALAAALAGAHRSDAHRARDRYRHPEETLLFFGFRPDMTVVEIWPGAGWYTEVLAPALKDRGKLHVAQYGSNPPFPYQRRDMETLAAKVAAAPDVYGDITFTALGFPDELEIAPPASADLVVTFRNVHNWFDPGYGPPNAPELAFKAMFDALKPGGILGVVDHRWPDPATEDPAAGNGYVSEARVIRYAEAAGFELAGRSEVNRNPRDTHDHPRGVWTLPPDLAMGEQDREKYVAIGESDRLTLKFVKPSR